MTEAGLDRLGAWMEVVAKERSALDAVLKRYDLVVEAADEPNRG